MKRADWFTIAALLVLACGAAFIPDATVSRILGAFGWILAALFLRLICSYREMITTEVAAMGVALDEVIQSIKAQK